MVLAGLPKLLRSRKRHLERAAGPLPLKVKNGPYLPWCISRGFGCRLHASFLWGNNIHPASRGVAAHTAGLFRSVRGAKGGFPPWGLFKLRSFNKKSFQNIVFDSVFPMFPVKQTVIYTFFAIKAVNPSKTLLLTVFL